MGFFRLKTKLRFFIIALTCSFNVWTQAGICAQNRQSSPGVDSFQGVFQNESNSPAEPLTLWYRRPANIWTEALPIGNGRLGAMIFGGIEGERIQLNEDTLWAGSPYDPSNPEALAALPEVRRLIFEGKYTEADALIGAKMMAKPLRMMPYQLVGDLRLAFPKAGSVSNYRRTLDIANAVSTVSYKIGDVTFTREIFSSAVDDVIVVRLTADKKGRISFDAAMQTPQKATVQNEYNNTLVMSGINGSARGIEGKLKFQSRVKVLTSGGTINSKCEKTEALFRPYSLANEAPDSKGVSQAATGVQKACLSVKNADSATLLISAATAYKNYKDISGDEAAKTKLPVENASKKSFENLKKAHIADYRKFFSRVSINLGNSKSSSLPTDERIKKFAESNDSQLAALYFQYGRYLLISSSRPGTQPANLQGLWNDSMTPPWDSKYTININTEMNYWLAEPTNLSEMTEPLVRMISEISETGKQTARVNWGARGWVTHHNTDLWRATAPVDGPKWGMWPLGGAWLTMSLWEHYEYTQDRAFLEKIYPILKGSCEFFLDTLVEEPKHKWLVTSPSVSPENSHPFGTSITAGPTIDEQIIRDLFTNTIQAAETLNKDRDFQEQLKQTRERLTPNQIGKTGQLQEWLEDWDLEAKDIHHRHVSHLYGAFPSWQINIFDTPALAAAAKKSLELRGDDATGWAIAWRLNLWARLGDGEHAYRILALLLRPERTYPNLFDAHPPFQIDGNFGGTNGIAEMLLQNRIKDGQTEINILPALPKAFPTGNIRGLRARRGFEVDVDWKDGKLTNAVIHSLLGSPVKLRYGSVTKTIQIKKGESFIWKGTD